MRGKHTCVSGDCPLCGTYRERLQRDRIVPRMRGGTYAPNNVQYICANCHEDKTRRENSAHFKGRKFTREWRRRISRANRRRVVTPAWRQALRDAAARRNFRHTPESKAKIVAALKGRHVTKATRAKLSRALRGHLVDEKTRRAVSASNRRRAAAGSLFFQKRAA